MRRSLHVMADLGSLLLSGAILWFFLGHPNYQPTGENGILWGMAIVLAIALVYIGIEAAPVMSDATPSPLYMALETFISHIPGYALLWVLAHWKLGATALSPFQWIVFAVAVFVIVVDVIGFVTILARRLLLTDEVKGIR